MPPLSRAARSTQDGSVPNVCPFALVSHETRLCVIHHGSSNAFHQVRDSLFSARPQSAIVVIGATALHTAFGRANRLACYRTAALKKALMMFPTYAGSPSGWRIRSALFALILSKASERSIFTSASSTDECWASSMSVTTRDEEK